MPSYTSGIYKTKSFMAAVCTFGSDLMSRLDTHLLLAVALMTLPALFLFVSLTGDSIKADKHLG